MLKNIIRKGIVGAALCAALMVTSFSDFTIKPAMAAPSGCLPASLKSKLAEIRQKFGPVSIVSTHRPGARIAGSGKSSYHASCRAVDFHPPKGKYSAVVAWLKANHAGGVGTYSCGMHHVHIDNGPRIRFHHCVNKYGTPLRKGPKRKYYASKKKSYKKYAYKGYKKKQYAYKAKKQDYGYQNSQKTYYSLGGAPRFSGY